MHTRGWTEAQLYGDNSAEAVDGLRWALFASLMSDAATADLESAKRDMDEHDQLERTKNPKMREALEGGFRHQRRIRLAKAFEGRKAIRLAILLSEVPDHG